MRAPSTVRDLLAKPFLLFHLFLGHRLAEILILKHLTYLDLVSAEHRVRAPLDSRLRENDGSFAKVSPKTAYKPSSIHLLTSIRY